MSKENIEELVRELIQENDALTDPNNCRDSAVVIANEIEREFPDATISFLAYPEARVGENVHYSVLVNNNGQKIIINTVVAPGLPQYIGDLELAVPTFSAMKESDVVL